jgi:hypothetical protein
MRTAILLLASLLSATVAFAQEDDRIAYTPKQRVVGDASTTRISVAARAHEGMLRVEAPADVYHVEVTNSRGRVISELPASGGIDLDISDYKPGTYMIRAHGEYGILLKRFVLMRPGGGLWLTDAATR